MSILREGSPHLLHVLVPGEDVHDLGILLLIIIIIICLAVNKEWKNKGNSKRIR